MNSPFKTKDSGLSFMVGQLDKFDPKFHEPLFLTTWQRDVDLRTDISLGNESSSFLRSSFAGGGTLNATGLPWIEQNTTAIPAVTVGGERVINPIKTLAREIAYSQLDLERAALLGQSMDTWQLNALNNKYQLETDQMVYIGASEVGMTGLLNSPLVGVSAVVNGASGSPLWKNKTPVEVLNDLNTALTAAWAATGYAVAPSKIGIPPAQYTYLTANLISTAGSASILTFLKDNSMTNALNGRALEIVPMKYLTGRGVGGTDRMIVYTKSEDRVRFPLVPMQRQTAYYHGIKFFAPYIWAYGQMEMLYPETVSYIDGI